MAPVSVALAKDSSVMHAMLLKHFLRNRLRVAAICLVFPPVEVCEN